MTITTAAPLDQHWYYDDSYYHARINNISEEKWQLIKNFTLQGMKCMIDFWDSPKPQGLYCDAVWDNLLCWEATPANTTVHKACPDHFISGGQDTVPVGHRTCLPDGTWKYPDWTNYSICVSIMLSYIQENQRHALDPKEVQQAIVISIIYFAGSIISAVLLLITLFIFSYFKALQCNRISIHKNLVVSFIVRCVVLIVLLEPLVTSRSSSYRDVSWLCKTFTVLQQYSLIANIFWMFVEGLFLHNRVAVSVFNSDAPFKVFYFVGWGLPAVIVVIWALCLHFTHEEPCWNDHFFLPYNWIILVPIIVALFVNLVFLVNIIRILITKLRAHNTVETEQVRKAVKALGVLYPLLGLTNVSFLVAPSGGAYVFVYRVTNAVLHSSQGIFVSVIYCFMNSEVRTAIKKKWVRYRSLRMDSSRRGSGGLKTSSIYLSENGISIIQRLFGSTERKTTEARSKPSFSDI